jgi:hypothetical protein
MTPSAAIIGGALVLGAWARICTFPAARCATLMALGAALLAGSRPYEGLVLCLPIALAMLVWLMGPRRPPLKTICYKIVVPAAIVFPMAGSLLAYHNWRVTGAAVKMPHQLHEAGYAVAPVFLWQAYRPAPVYRHAVMKHFYTVWAPQYYWKQQDISSTVRFKRHAFIELWCFFVRPPLAIPLLTVPWMLKRRRQRLLMAMLLSFAAAWTMVTWSTAHYLTPAVPIFFLLAVQGFRHLRVWVCLRRKIGRFAVSALLSLYAAFSLLSILSNALAAPPGWHLERARLQQQLERTAGRHLVVVRYDIGHDVHREWVYNSADIDSAKVVWAREMDAEDNRRLLAYFKGRRFWLLLADATPARLIEHPQE